MGKVADSDDGFAKQNFRLAIRAEERAVGFEFRIGGYGLTIDFALGAEHGERIEMILP